MISDAEYSVLMIAAEGEYMLAIGHWEAPTKSLASRGLMQCQQINGGPQYTITQAGRDAVAQRATDDDKRLTAALVSSNNEVAGIRTHIERAAEHLAIAARKSKDITGDDPKYAAKRWSDEIHRVALEMLK